MYNYFEINNTFYNHPEKIVEMIEKYLKDKQYRQAIDLARKSGVLTNYRCKDKRLKIKVKKLFIKHIFKNKDIISMYLDSSSINKIEERLTNEDTVIIQSNESLLLKIIDFLENTIKFNKDNMINTESVTQSASIMLKDLYNSGAIEIPQKALQMNDISLIFAFYNRRSTSQNINNLWRMGFLHFKYSFLNTYMIEDGELAENRLICGLTIDDLIYLREIKKMVIDKKENFDTKYAEILNYLSDSLFIDEGTCEQKYDGVCIKDWIKICVALNIISENYLKLDLGIIKISENELIDKIRSFNINRNSIIKCIRALTFSKNSRDLYDTPLIKINETYYLLPNHINLIIFGNSLFSLFTKNNVLKLEAKGTNFEEYIHEILENSKIKKIGNMKKSKKQYEIDGAFLINNDLFILEIKTLKNPVTHEEYLEAINKMENYLIRFEEIYNYFKSNCINEIKRKLGVDDVSSITPLFISNIVSPMTSFREIKIMDYFSFKQYFSRIQQMVELSKFKFVGISYGYEKFFSGSINKEQFLSVIKLNPYYKTQKHRIVKEKDYFKFYRYNYSELKYKLRY
ncbi:hypothetical protein [Clostridium sp.]|uniref:hypothetical protein n=1 Tax=Clostridium sp. TaxID=1506 RepID=UPI003217C8C1